MSEIDPYAIWLGLDAEFAAGYLDGKNPDNPEPSENRHPAYKHSFEVARAEAAGRPIPAWWARKRAAHITAGGGFYHFSKSESIA